MTLAVPERVSIELTRQCQKACSFCYNGSAPDLDDAWSPDDIVLLVRSLAEHGTRAVSLGGGEPLEYPGLERVFDSLRGVVFLSMTTNGLLLDQQLDRISRLSPAKIHISIHFPSREREVARVIRQVLLLRRMGIRAGVNLLIRRTEIEASATAAARLRDAGIGNDAIMYLPMRGELTPSAAEIATVAGSDHFQSMTCLLECGRSARFCSIDAEQCVAHCSYTVTRRKLASLDATGLSEALAGLGLAFCGDDVPNMPANRTAG